MPAARFYMVKAETGTFELFHQLYLKDKAAGKAKLAFMRKHKASEVFSTPQSGIVGITFTDKKLLKSPPSASWKVFKKEVRGMSSGRTPFVPDIKTKEGKALRAEMSEPKYRTSDDWDIADIACPKSNKQYFLDGQYIRFGYQRLDDEFIVICDARFKVNSDLERISDIEYERILEQENKKLKRTTNKKKSTAK